MAKTTSLIPTDATLTKLLYLAGQQAQQNWTKRVPNWGEILGHLVIYFEDRVTPYLKQPHGTLRKTLDTHGNRRVGVIIDISVYDCERRGGRHHHSSQSVRASQHMVTGPRAGAIGQCFWYLQRTGAQEPRTQRTR